MARLLPALRADIRIDLHDTTVTPIWTDAQLNRHIARAVAEYQAVAPRVVSTLHSGDGTTRRFDISAATGLMWIERIEHPLDEPTPRYLPFREESRGVAYIVEPADPPSPGTNNIRFWYARTHTLDATTTTIPDPDDELIALGASAYAALAIARLTTLRTNPAAWTPERAREWGDARLAEFHARLAALAAARATPLPRPHWGPVSRDWHRL